MLYWIGPRDSDIDYVEDLFDGSIVLFGDEMREKSSAFCKHYHSRVNHNIIDEDQDNFTISEILFRLDNDPEARFMFYNPNIVFKIRKLKEIQEHIVCLNNKDLMELVNNKISFHRYFGTVASLLPTKTVKGEKCNFISLKKIFNAFNENCKFIVQVPVASGGFGTYLMDKNSADILQKDIIADQFYLVSEYLMQSIPVNGHLIIFEKNIIMIPCSVQIMKLSDNRIFYRGADFITYQKISAEKRKLFEADLMKVGKELQRMGYRGICGIDGIITENKVYILEINNRFQASTPLVNLELTKRGLPSIHELNLKAFSRKELPAGLQGKIESIRINYSNFVFLSGNVDFHYKIFLKKTRGKGCTYINSITLDGFDPMQSSEKDSYQYRVVFNTNITDIDPNGQVVIHCNIEEPGYSFYKKVEQKNLLYLKIALLNQGVNFSSAAQKYLMDQGGYRLGTNCSVDILFDDVVINSPVKLKFIEFTPFSIELNQDKLQLYYYGGRLKNVIINPVDPFASLQTKNGIFYDCIACMSSDRLRIHHTNACFFKKKHIGCKFCDIQVGTLNFELEDIMEVTEYYLTHGKFKHFLLGGQSSNQESEYEYIIETARFIRDRSDKKIYVMCLPPKNKEWIRKIYEAGATEIALNIEIFDRKKAYELMPGKGRISLEQYIKDLKEAVKYFGGNGETRSLIIVGLEKEESLLKGIEVLAQNHIQPILSAFRPIPGTPMEECIPPSNQSLIDLFYKAEAICRRYGMKLGPECTACQNNTISLPYTKESD